MMMSATQNRETDNVTQDYIVFEVYSRWIRKTKARYTSARGIEMVATDLRRAVDPVSPRWYEETIRELARDVQEASDARIIVIFDRMSAVLTQQHVLLPRADWNAEISAPELDTAIRHGVWKSAQQERVRAGRALGVHELQVRLADVDIVRMRVDGHRVVSPIGFRGHELECLFREVFIKAEMWNVIAHSLPAERIATMTERSGMWASWVLGPAKQEGVFLDISEHETVISLLGDDVITYRDTVTWGTDVFFAGVAGAFGLPASSAQMLIDRYQQRMCSFTMGRAIENALTSEFSTLLHAIDASRIHKAVPVFVHSMVPLPSLTAMPHLLQRLGESAGYRLCRLETVLGEDAPVVHYNREVIIDSHAPSFDTLCMVIARLHGSRHETSLGKTAKQRVRWIADQV